MVMASWDGVKYYIMKLTKKTLKQLIRETMAARSFEDMEREFEAGEKADESVVQRAVVRTPDGEKVELERTAAMSDLDWENVKRVAMGGSAKKPASYAKRHQKRHQKRQDAQVAAYRAYQKKKALLDPVGILTKEPQFEQTVRAVVREELEAVLEEDDFDPKKKDFPGLSGWKEREENREASCKAWKALEKTVPDWCDEYLNKE